jgi:hypothetical protein
VRRFGRYEADDRPTTQRAAGRSAHKAALTKRRPDVSDIGPTTQKRLLEPGNRAEQASDTPCTRVCQRLATLRPRMDESVAELRFDRKAVDLMTMGFAA